MSKRLDKLEEKVDHIQQNMAEINKTLAVNTESLIHHVKRTDLLEAKINSLPQKALTYVSLLSGVLAILSKLL